ncbi:hypothetical protein [Flavobacterium litorale]|uniref:MORN repeat variant n=1 Tax=Flavobacterium litorale TaxID=2856519 RepID=A0ABX8VA44_9FLAO|nr:hypothetical protein [Flavobacterium litorale]QYJ67675.1 hypothetical protein K1I41_08965 [Flavobacterium litorale]
MKKIAAIAFLALGISLNAQVNKNVTKETKTTTITVDNGKEEQQFVKTEKVKTEQDIKFKDAESDKLNKKIAETPVKVNKSTTYSGDKLVTTNVNTTYYMLNGKRYTLKGNNGNGYTMASPENSNYGVLKTNGDNRYSCKIDGKTSVGYFDQKGNLVIETRNNDGRGKMVETYTLLKK